MKTMTIRNIPDSVAAGLAESARSSGRSMNATAIAALSNIFDANSRRNPKNDFSDFLGKWTKEEADAFDKTVEESCERIDSQDWPLFAAETTK